MTEFGIFGAEGMFEGDFYSREAAEAAMAERYAEDAQDGDAYVSEVCPEHRDEPKEGCSKCPGDEDDDEGEEGDDEEEDA